VARRARAGDSLRVISDFVVNEGHALGKDGVAAHLKVCVGIKGQTDGSDPQTRSVLAATIVSRVLQRWPSLGHEVASGYSQNGLAVEADIVLSVLPEAMQRALAEVETTPAGELLASRCLAVAVSRVFSGGRHAAVTKEIAAELVEQGAHDLVDSLLSLTEREAQVAAPRPGASAAEPCRPPSQAGATATP